jgi:hypothetical protein
MQNAANILTSTLFFTTVLFVTPSFAQSKMSECFGRLHQDQSGLLIGGGKGEGESICVIAKSEQSKVSATCTPEQLCRVRGRVSNCKDAGECAEISGIVSVSKH